MGTSRMSWSNAERSRDMKNGRQAERKMSWKCFNTPSRNSGRKKTKKTTGKNLVIIASIPVVHRRVSDAVRYQRALRLRKIDEKTKNLRSTLLRIFGSWNVEEKLEKITEGSKYCGYFSDLRGPWAPWKYREDFEISRTCKIHSKSSRTQLIFFPHTPEWKLRNKWASETRFWYMPTFGMLWSPGKDSGWLEGWQILLRAQETRPFSMLCCCCTSELRGQSETQGAGTRWMYPKWRKRHRKVLTIISRYLKSSLNRKETERKENGRGSFRWPEGPINSAFSKFVTHPRVPLGILKSSHRIRSSRKTFDSQGGKGAERPWPKYSIFKIQRSPKFTSSLCKKPLNFILLELWNAVLFYEATVWKFCGWFFVYFFEKIVTRLWIKLRLILREILRSECPLKITFQYPRRISRFLEVTAHTWSQSQRDIFGAHQRE